MAFPARLAAFVAVAVCLFSDCVRASQDLVSWDAYRKMADIQAPVLSRGFKNGDELVAFIRDDISPADAQHIINAVNSRPGVVQTVHLATHWVEHMSTTLLAHIKEPFVLITSWDDVELGVNDGIVYRPEMSHPGVEFWIMSAVLNDPLVLHWFSTNAMTTHDKLTHLPSGVDDVMYQLPTGNHSAQFLSRPPLRPTEIAASLSALQRQAPPLSQRQDKAYSYFHLLGYKWGNTGMRETRKAAYYGLKHSVPDRVEWQSNFLPRERVWASMVNYQFVPSPPGMGEDCFRTWEALALGCVPIVRSGFLNALFEGLPVYVVNDWAKMDWGDLQRFAANLTEAHWTKAREVLSADAWQKRIDASKLRPKA